MNYKFDSRVSEQSAQISTFPDHPIPLLIVNEDETFRVNEEALENLRNINSKIAIIAVAGLYRTGKSSLLNWLMDKQSGFAVGPTVQRCTRGIWIWGRPRVCYLPNGEECWAVLLDTEGIGGLEADSHYDARIFSLSTLLCSTLVYNSLGSIDENAINSLSFIANLSQHIRISSGTGPVREEEEALKFHQFFPSFHWVIRDFALDLVDEDGEKITSDEYLQRSLRMQPGFDKDTAERNRIRHMLTSFFQDRHLTTLVRPINDEEALQRIDTVPYRSLRMEFRKSLEALKKQLFEEIKPKALGGRELNGAMFAGLCQAYVQAINEGGVPTISSAWQGVSRQECRDALEAGVSKSQEAFGDLFGPQLEKLPIETKELFAGFKSACSQALELYDSRALGEHVLMFRGKLQERLDEELDQLNQRNLEASTQACESMLQSVFSEILHPKIHGQADRSILTVESIQQDFEKLRLQYLRLAKGPAKEMCLAQFTFARWPEAATALLQRQAQRSDELLRHREAELASAQADAQWARSQLQQMQHKLEQIESEVAGARTDKIALETQLELQNQRVNEATSKLKTAELKLDELSELLATQTSTAEKTAEAFEEAKIYWEQERQAQTQRMKDLESTVEQQAQDIRESEEAFQRTLQDQLLKHSTEIEEIRQNAESKRRETLAEIHGLRSTTSHQLQDSEALRIAENAKLELQAELEKKKRNEARLEKELEQVSNKLEEMKISFETQLEENSEETTMRKNTLRFEIQKLQQQNNEIIIEYEEKIEKMFGDSDERCAQLELALKEKEAEVEHFKNLLDASHPDENISSNNSIKTPALPEEYNASLPEEYNHQDLTAEIRKLERQCDQLEQERERTDQEHADQMEKMDQELNAKEQELETVHEELNQLKHKYEQLVNQRSQQEVPETKGDDQDAELQQKKEEFLRKLEHVGVEFKKHGRRGAAKHRMLRYDRASGKIFYADVHSTSKGSPQKDVTNPKPTRCLLLDGLSVISGRNPHLFTSKANADLCLSLVSNNTSPQHSGRPVLNIECLDPLRKKELVDGFMLLTEHLHPILPTTKRNFINDETTRNQLQNQNPVQGINHLDHSDQGPIRPNQDQERHLNDESQDSGEDEL